MSGRRWRHTFDPLGCRYDGAASAARKVYRIYADRLTAAAILTDPAL